MSERPETIDVPSGAVPPITRVWAMTMTEKMLMQTLLNQRASIEQQMSLVWTDAAARIGVAVNTRVEGNMERGAWLEKPSAA